MNVILERFDTGKPFSVSRFGSVEIQYYLCYKYTVLKPFLIRRAKLNGHKNAGIFPFTSHTGKSFVNEIDIALKDIDILGSWRTEELILYPKLKSVSKMGLHDISPFSTSGNWLKILNLKRVLVIHPFKQTILHQYERRNKVFQSALYRPDFKSIEILVPPQTNAYRTEGYDSWMSAFNELKKLVAEKEFDVALIGCGSYGMPIAAHIKKLGKVAIHLGGSTQLLFGIHGRRWDNDERYNHIKTDHWCRPLASDTISNKELVENACYW